MRHAIRAGRRGHCNWLGQALWACWLGLGRADGTPSGSKQADRLSETRPLVFPLYIYIYIYVYVYMYLFLDVHIFTVRFLHAYVYAYMYIYIYIYIYISMYLVSIHIYICIYLYISDSGLSSELLGRPSGGPWRGARGGLGHLSGFLGGPWGVFRDPKVALGRSEGVPGWTLWVHQEPQRAPNQFPDATWLVLAVQKSCHKLGTMLFPFCFAFVPNLYQNVRAALPRGVH